MKKITNSFQIGFLIVKYVLINYGTKCKIQLPSNDFSMLKVDGSTHVPCW